ncbi:DMT family transporter [Candidatus Kaiserbacteria bacterium]|nr:DMT family transporter [Candidatus Kaiserbacteria bacterium]
MFMPLWFIVGLISLFIGVIGSFFDKYLLEKYFSNSTESENGAGALIIFSAFFLIVLYPIMLFFGYDKIDFNITVGWVGLISGIMSGLWILLYLHALDRVDVSQAIPIFQTIPIFGLILAYFTLGEVLTKVQILASLILILGASVLIRTKEESFSSQYKALFLMLGSSFFVALSQVVFKVVAVDINYWTGIFWNWVGFILFGSILFVSVKEYRAQFMYLAKQRVSSIKSVYGISALNEVFDNISDLTFLLAVILGPIGLVQSLNAYEPIIVLIFSSLMVKVSPKYFLGDFSKSTFEQKFVGILIITTGSFILYTTLG